MRQVLYDYFAWATTTTMSLYHHSADDARAGLSIPRWSSEVWLLPPESMWDERIDLPQVQPQSDSSMNTAIVGSTGTTNIAAQGMLPID